MVHPDNTLIEVPIVLRDLIAEQRLHERQPYYEVVEEAVLYWLEMGGWMPGRLVFTDIARPLAKRRRVGARRVLRSGVKPSGGGR